MKYKCLVCGQIIDNNEMCPFCGSDSSQIVPLDNANKKGHYRCMVCGKETDNGEYCPYCGSQRLYNLDTQKEEDTQSVPVMQDNVDIDEEPLTEKEEEMDNDAESKPEESLESRYFNMFGELLPLDSVKNPDPNKVESLYRIGLNRGEKITPDEVANAFSEPKEEPLEHQDYSHQATFNTASYHFVEKDDENKDIIKKVNVDEEGHPEEEENVEPAEEFIKEPAEDVDEAIKENEEVVEETPKAVEEPEVTVEEEKNVVTNTPIVEEKEDDYEVIINRLVRSIDAYSVLASDDKVTNDMLAHLRSDLIVDYSSSDKEELKNNIVNTLEKLVAYDKENETDNLSKDEKYLKIVKILFDKE